MRNRNIIFQENRYSKREIEREGGLLEKLLVLTLVHISHGFCFTSHEKCAYSLKDYCIISRKKLIVEERERERESDFLEKFLVLILVHFSLGFCFAFQKKIAFFQNYCILFQEKRYSKREIEREGGLLEKLLVLTLVHSSPGFGFTFHENCAYFLTVTA